MLKRSILLICVSLFLMACTQTGPQKTLQSLADAIEKRDASLFLTHIDRKSYAINEVRTRTAQSSGLSALDNMGRQLGLGGMEDLLGSVIDLEKDLQQTFTRGINTGELEAQCRTRIKADCPWVAASLRDAQIKTLGENAAVARVNTPANITSWLALQKKDQTWVLVGKAHEEALAIRYATDIQEEPAPSTSL